MIKSPHRVEIVKTPLVELRRSAFDVAKQRYPQVELEFETFQRHLERLGHRTSLPDHSSAVYLCAACAERRLAAWKALELEFFPSLPLAVSRVVPERHQVQEVLQELRRRLFIGSPPRIATYRGNGPLAAWLRTVAVNLALDLRRVQLSQLRHQREIERWTQTSGRVGESPLLEDEMFDRQCAPLFERALLAAVAELGPAGRRLLHLHVVEGLGIDVLGAMYSINRATAARRIRRHLDSIAADVLARLSADLGPLSREELARVAGLWNRCSGMDMAHLFRPPLESIDGSAPSPSRPADPKPGASEEPRRLHVLPVPGDAPSPLRYVGPPSASPRAEVDQRRGVGGR
jgi:RNA polymerase sigma-70 factor, ECF subfamily